MSVVEGQQRKSFARIELFRVWTHFGSAVCAAAILTMIVFAVDSVQPSPFYDTTSIDPADDFPTTDIPTPPSAVDGDSLALGFSETRYSTLRPHEAMGMLRTQDVMVEIGYPLPAGDRHI